MARCRQSTGKKGSKKWIQKLVNEKPRLLSSRIAEELKLPESERVRWLSPLKNDEYAEYSDWESLNLLDVSLEKRLLADFWPENGPQWDALGKSDSGKLFLVEAKSHISELSSSIGAKDENSVRRIRQSLEETKAWFLVFSFVFWLRMPYKLRFLWIVLTLLTVLTILALGFVTNNGYYLNNANCGSYVSVNSNDVAYNMTVDVRVLDIDQKTSHADIEIFVRLGPLPHQFNETGVIVQIHDLGNGDLVFMICNYTAGDTNGKYFSGNSSSSLFLIGRGELFPFDIYFMIFTISPLEDIKFRISEATSIFHGQKVQPLCDTWENQGHEIPMIINESEEITLTGIIKRNWIIPFLGLIMPIVLCYYLLGASMFIDPKARMQEILTMYISIFVFVPMFFTAIQDSLPYKSLLSLPEFLLTYLITSICLFGVSIMLHEPAEAFKRRYAKFPPSEFFGLLLSLIVFLVLYLFLFFPIMIWPGSEGAMWTFLLVIISYVLGVFGLFYLFKQEKQKSEKSKMHRFFPVFE